MIRNNSVQINDYWFSKVLHSISANDWQDLSCFFYKNTWTISELSEFLDCDDSETESILKRLEKRGLIYSDGKKFGLQVNEAVHKFQPKAAKETKLKIIFEYSGNELPATEDWSYFLSGFKMSDKVRQIMFLVYEATGLDQSDPYKNIINVNDWITNAGKCLTLADGNIDLIKTAIAGLQSKKFTISTPRSLFKSILFAKQQGLVKNDTANVDGYFL